MNEAERQTAYRNRLDQAGKTVIRIVVSKAVASKLSRMASGAVSRQGEILAKALAALEAQEMAESVEEDSGA